MSRGPGKIEKALEAIFAVSDDEFTTKDLAQLVYPGFVGHSDNTIRLAMSRLEKRIGLAKRHICCKGGGWTWGYRRQ
jgi:hypothetical protein